MGVQFSCENADTHDRPIIVLPMAGIISGCPVIFRRPESDCPASAALKTNCPDKRIVAFMAKQVYCIARDRDLNASVVFLLINRIKESNRQINEAAVLLFNCFLPDNVNISISLPC
jgi:hypothetical protein